MKKTRLFSLLLATMMIVGAFVVLPTVKVKAEVPAAGAGTEGDPYLIATQADLALIGDAEADTYWKLADDLTLSSWAAVTVGTGVTLNGDGHTIYGLSGAAVSLFSTVSGTVKDLSVDGGVGKTSINAKGSFNYGIIAAILDGGMISGCTVKNYRITYSGTYKMSDSSQCYGCGGIAGRMKGDATIKNCTFESTNSITQDAKSAGSYAGPIGGIVGFIELGNATISGCMSEAAIQSNQNTWLGGIVGDVRGGSSTVVTLTDCVNKGTLKGTGGSVNVGGVIAYVGARAKISITNCTNTGNLTAYGSAYAGGIIGTSYANGSGFEKYDLTIQNCVADCTISGNTVGGLVGYWVADRNSGTTMPKVSISGCEVKGALIGPTINAIGYFARSNAARYFNPMTIRHTVVSATVDDGDENNETAPTLAIVARKSGMTGTDKITIEDSIFSAFGDADWVSVDGYLTLTLTKCIKGNNYYATAGDDPVDLGATCMTDGAAVNKLNAEYDAGNWIQGASSPLYLPKYLAFSSASLTLTDSFAINMMLRLPEAGEARTAIDTALDAGDLTVEASVGGGDPILLSTSTVTKGGADYLRCSFANLSATQMNATVTFSSVYGGKVSKSLEYSVENYAARMYEKDTSSEELKDLLVAMMYYGDAAEQKAGTDAAETVLAAFKTAIGDDSVAPAKDYAALALADGSEGTGVTVGLILGTRIEVCFAGLLAEPTVTANGDDMLVTDNGDGTYSVFVNASGLNVRLTVNSAVTFSVGDYIARGIDGDLFTAAEEAVAQALAVYMDATLTYAKTLD